MTSAGGEVQECEKSASIELQYDSLKYYYVKMMGQTMSFNWYKRFDGVSCIKPKMIEDMPCECGLEECKISENTEEGCKVEMEKPTKQESSAEELNTSIKSQIQEIAKHKNTCNAMRICLYFSCLAKYFIEEEVDPDTFLYIPFPKGKYGEDLVDYKYYSLQESRKILILKLLEGLRRKLESWVEGMTKIDKIRYEYRNEVRIAKHLVLNNLLEDLVKPYEKFTYEKENNDDNDSKQNASKQIADQIDQDKSRYLLLKAEYQSLKIILEKEASERRDVVLIDDALHFDYYISYEEFLEQEKSKENKPSTSKDKELEIENMNETEPATDEPESETKMSDSEQATDETESESKKGDSEPEMEELKSKRKKFDSDEETEEPEGKRKKCHSEEETEEQEGKTKMDDSEQKTEELQGKRKMDDSDSETEEQEIKRKRKVELSNENSESRK